MASLNKLTIGKDSNHVDNITLGIDPASVSTYANGRFVSNVPSRFYITNTQSVPLDAMADYVVECQRVAQNDEYPGVWYYRKWAKGLLEVWFWSNSSNYSSLSGVSSGVSNTDGKADYNYFARGPIYNTNKKVTKFPPGVQFIERPRCFYLGGCLGYPFGDTTLPSYSTIPRHHYTSSTVAGWTATYPGYVGFIKPSNRVSNTTSVQDSGKVIDNNPDRPAWVNIMYRGRWK